jgi:hypothetical protein
MSFRYRRSSNHSASATARSLRSRLPPKAHAWHLATIGSTLLPALLLLLSSCSQATGPVTGRVTATPSMVPTPTPTPYVPPPTPISPPLGLPPRDCHPGPMPRPIFSDVGPGYGSFPVWAFGLDTTVRIATSYFTYTQYGWEWKVLWRVSTRYTQPVRLHGGNLRTGTPLWFQIGDQDPSTAPVLDPRPREQQIAQSGYPADTVGWGSYLLIPTAGCYYVEADWQGGSWRGTFAAGRL